MLRNMVLLAFLASGAAVAGDFNGMWDAVMNANGVPVPFRMEVTGSPLRVCFFEGSQPVCSTSAQIEDGKLVSRWDYLNTELRLEAEAGKLSGYYRNLRRPLGNKLEAHPHRPPAPAVEKPAKLDGIWEIHSNEKPELSWQLILDQSDADLKGTVLRVDGDDGTLTGRIEGKHFIISHFSGDRPTVVEGKLVEDGKLDLTQGKVQLYALRPDLARERHLKPPLDPATYAKAKDPSEPFRFSFPDLDGRMVTQAAFSGKPFIVSITGSWCPNCRDEAPFLAELYQRYRDRGLAIVGFCFENADDSNYGPLHAFIRKYGIAYPMLLAGEPGKLKEAVPQIENLGAFPTSIFVGKDGRVRQVHTGFPSPGSGEERIRVEKELTAVVEQMLVDRPGHRK